MDARSPWLLAGDRVAIALVRHGQTAWNVERRFLGRTDLPLDPIGLAQVAELGRRCAVPFAKVYSSPLQRARVTASHLGDPVIVEALAEMSQGELEGLGFMEVVERYPGFFETYTATTVAPGGESVTSTRDRALPVVIDIARAHSPGEIVAIVAHQIVIASISCTIAGHPLDRWRDHGVPNATITWLAWDGERFEILAKGWTPEAPR